MSDEADGTAASPTTRKTRMQEKEELAYLNDRFATYAGTVRSLKEAKEHYEYDLKQNKEKYGRDTDEIKRLYENELADARRLIDETAKEKARQQLNASKNASRVKELEAELEEMKQDNEALKARLNSAERSNLSLDTQRKTAHAENIDLLKRIRELEGERDELRVNVEELRAALETETLLKVDYQNNLQSLKEELAFKTKVHDEEMHNLHTRSHFKTYSESFEPSVTEINLDDLRESSDQRITEFKDMMEASYRDKIDKLENQQVRDASVINQLNVDIRKFTSSMDARNNEITKLQGLIEKLECQLTEKDRQLARMVEKHASEVNSLREHIHTISESYKAKIKEYEDLMDLKIHLDQEIATYRALLEEEESRLNMTPTPRGEKRRSRTQTAEQSAKKQRLDTTPTLQTASSSQVSSSAAGCIQISDVDAEGRYVKIKNMSSSAESVGGFKIVHEVDSGREISFKFHQKSKLQGGASVTVWGSEAVGARHNPPHEIIWRNQPEWGSGGKTVTKLVSKGSEVVATFTQRKETSPVKDPASSSILSFPHLPDTERDTTPFARPPVRHEGDEHMFHQRGDPQDRPRESCIIS